jgi:hypothetical protein
MKEKAVRFGITNEFGERASTWICFAHKGENGSDIYLANRVLGGSLKASMHKSGKWHIAFSKEFFNDNLDSFIDNPRGRFLDKWNCPADIHSGLTLALRIVTPYSAVNVPNSISDEKIKWIQITSNLEAIEIDIFIALKDVLVSSWPGKNAMKTKLVGSLLTTNGEKVWIVYRAIELPAFKAATGKPRYFKGMNYDSLKGDGIRALAFKPEKDGSRTIFDASVVTKLNSKY